MFVVAFQFSEALFAELRSNFLKFPFREMGTCLEISSIERRLHFSMRNVDKMLR